MTGRRIEFPSDDAARFNALRDEWRGVAASLPLSASARRVATVLPTYVSREYGYAFPTDEQLAGDIKSDPKTAKRGLTALEGADLIERDTTTRRGAGVVAGKMRRIFLCLPTEGTTEPVPKGQESASPKGQPPRGQVENKGQKTPTEGTYGCPYIPDTHTPDLKIRFGDRKGSVYEEDVPSVAPVPSAQAVPSAPAQKSAGRKFDPLPRNPYPELGSWGSDTEFLATFDRLVLEKSQHGVGAGEIRRICEEAFDETTRSSGDFMPVFWSDIVEVRTNNRVDWWLFRTSTLVHRREAA